MNILVTGSNGQLGSELRELEKQYKQYKFFFTDFHELDITNAEKTMQFVKSNKIETVVNCAGFTAVDAAEAQKSEAALINATGAKNLAQACAKVNALLIHISTDYVFEGRSFKPYTENDTAGPKTTYGKTKLDGEIEVIFNAKRALIFRTSWLYSSYGRNFIKTIVEKAKAEKELKVVYDQVGNPTYAGDLAKAILDIIPKVPQKIRTEIYNYSNEGVASWYDLAHAIIRIKNIDCQLKPVLSKEFPSEAIRPHYSVLNKARVKNEFGISIPHWRDSLEKCLEKL
ncbi:MAG: dTDP-4-dehydrorhamnose reductase [Bacteroidetes bacterium]|nr:MAG: dTDP-4-dehydrorhamnose reductase [Bacteroidota bacterium]